MADAGAKTDGADIFCKHFNGTSPGLHLGSAGSDPGILAVYTCSWGCRFYQHFCLPLQFSAPDLIMLCLPLSGCSPSGAGSRGGGLSSWSAASTRARRSSSPSCTGKTPRMRRVLAQRLLWWVESLVRSSSTWSLWEGDSSFSLLRTEALCPHLATGLM